MFSETCSLQWYFPLTPCMLRAPYRAARNRISLVHFCWGPNGWWHSKFALFPLYLVSTSPLEQNLSSVAECEPISSFSCKWENESFFKKKSIYLCIWLCWILAAAHRVLHLHWSMLGSSVLHMWDPALTRDWTRALALGVQCVSHWITREIPENGAFYYKSLVFRANLWFPMLGINLIFPPTPISSG